MEQNLDEIPELLAFCLAQKLRISFAALLNPIAPVHWGDSWQDYKELWPADKKRLAATFEKIFSFKKRNKGFVLNSDKYLRFLQDYYLDPCQAEVKKPCEIWFSSLTIYETGDAYLCGLRKPVGNVLEEPIKSLWFSQKALDSRMEMRTCNIPCQVIRGFYQESFIEKSKKFLNDFCSFR